MKQVLALLLTLFTLFSLTGCNPDKSAIPTVYAITQAKNEDASEPDHWILRPGRKPKRITSFSPDAVEIYEVDCSKITATVVHGQVQNQVDLVRVTDSEGNPVSDPILETLVTSVALSIPHSLYRFTIIKDSGYYFTFISLNVNWNDPCILSIYNPNTQKQHTLGRWNHVDLIGLHVNAP